MSHHRWHGGTPDSCARRGCDRRAGGGSGARPGPGGELLGYLVARRRRPATTDDLVRALWDEDPPATAATIVHGLVHRIRGALGAEAVVSDPSGYQLGPCIADVDLWTLLDLIDAGEVASTRASWREPVFGPYADRRWARAAVEPVRALVEPDREALLRTRRRVPVRRLVGRRRELAAVHPGLRHSRVVTVVGMGGVGKTGWRWRCAHDVEGAGDPHRRGRGGRPRGLPGGHRARPSEQRRTR